MTPELYILGWTVILAIVQIILPGVERSKQVSLKWNAGPRDEPPPPPTVIGGRLLRAQANLMETLPLFAAAVLIAHVAHREGASTLVGSIMFLVGRLVYLPLYALGVPVVRTFAWGASLLGLLLVLLAILFPV